MTMQHRKIAKPDRAAFDRIGPEILETIWEGIMHGFGEYCLLIVTEKGNRRTITMKAGKNLRFIVPPVEAKEENDK